MTNFKLVDISLASFKERRARKVSFHPRMTVVRGENQTGKSSLLKSIFWAFGAEPAKVHPRWKEADVRAVVRFTLDDRSYAVARHGRTVAFFDASNRLLKRCENVTRELAPYFAGLVRFGLRLRDRGEGLIALPPAYFLLPFYMDQDASWNRQWNAFANLGQIQNWRASVLEFHAGIRGNEYYEAKARKLEAESDLKKLEVRHQALKTIYVSLQGRIDGARFDLDLGAYQQEVEELLIRCERLRAQEEEYRARVVELRNRKTVLLMQLAIAKHALQEAHADYTYAAPEKLGEHVECPTCGAEYENSFAERFSIATDEDRCADLALRLRSELEHVDIALQKELGALRPLSEEIDAVNNLLARREGEIQLVDIFRQEGRRELREVMARDLAEIETAQGETRNRMVEGDDRMKTLDSKERRADVNGFFRAQMKDHLTFLDVLTLSEDTYASVEASVSGTGSELPRALLAYQLALLDTIKRSGTATFAPVVIDSPNQQDQDKSHIARILRCIAERRQADSQFIVGMTDTMGQKFEGSEIVLTEKYALLNEESFDAVGAEVRAFVDTMIA